MHLMTRRCTAVILLLLSPRVFAQEPDWKQIESQALETLQAYVRINTSNPPGDVTKAADFLMSPLRDGRLSSRG
jgi:hypothetical protein